MFHRNKKGLTDILPLHKVEIGAWAEQNFLFGVLMEQETGWDWIVNQFIQLRGSHYMRYAWNDIDSSITFYPYGIHQLTPNIFDLCPYINKYTIPKSMILANYKNFHLFAKLAIHQKFYLSTFLDQFFREDKHGNYGFHHPSFIYGYDDKLKKVYLADNFEKGKYGTKVITYEQLDRAFELVTGDMWEVSVFLYKAVPYKHQFSSRYVKEQIEDYLKPGQGVCYLNRTICPESFHRDEEYMNEVFFGIDCYKLLFSYLEAVLENSAEYVDNDWRSFVLLCDHKYLMIRRYEYMVRNGYMREDIALHKGLKDLEQECRILRNMFIKYTITDETDIIKRMIERIKGVKEADERHMKLFLDRIY